MFSNTAAKLDADLPPELIWEAMAYLKRALI
jgi:hypothetical protein